MEESLKKKTTKALVWSSADKVGQQLFYLVAGIILARQLSPTDYGKVGVLTIFIALSGILIDSGFSSALIRKKEATQADYSTVFYLNIAISCLLYGLLYAAAPLIADFFNVPDLTLICRVLFLVIPMNALSLIQQTLLFKHFKLSVSARVNLWALGLASVAAVVMAYCGMEVWSLVTQTLGLAVLRALFFWLFNDWRPQWIFRMASLREFFGYSSNLVISGIINNVFNKIYPIIIGKFYGMTQTGYYTQADKYQDIASALIGNIFRSVAFPVFSTVQDDLQRLKRICRKNVRAISFFIFPIMLLMVVVSYPFILLVLKEQWLPSVPYFRLLCLSGICSPFIILFYDLFNSLGYSRLNLQLEIGKKAYLFIGIALFYSTGIMYLIGWWVSYSVLSLVASIFFARRFIGYGYVEYFKDILPYLLLALTSAIVSAGVYWLLPGNVWRLCVVPVVYAILYLGSAYALKLEMWQEMMAMLKARLQKGGEA
ncbi:lipopolysaccharide biosynthesis protein [Barnesiella sp. An55]|uniref:lipopolysaccharide biosynthesis protein n=1 Tax=Barnesiella sp. An55 TaxID=1965646 RepID=UPI000B392003|nr:lipopolysaccharide biosynthesis protein [Barnesiella sp. An55]OUN73189.1 lipopolysaccharide biosynthesis protein [Barnesiella sp. An55]